MILDENELVELGDNLALFIDPSEFQFRMYSGRGMYGSYCFGVDMRSNNDLEKLGAALALTFSGHDLDRILSRARHDAMGYGAITYFPGIETTQETIDNCGYGESND